VHSQFSHVQVSHAQSGPHFVHWQSPACAKEMSESVCVSVVMAYHYPVLPEGNPCDAWWTGMVTTFRRTALSEGERNADSQPTGRARASAEPLAGNHSLPFQTHWPSGERKIPWPRPSRPR